MNGMKFVVGALWMIGCSGAKEEPIEPTGTGKTDVRIPDVSAASFVTGIDNPFMPMPVGATWVLEAQGEEGLEHIEIEVLAETKTIEGITATVVRDSAYLDGVLVEDTDDWFAQDSEGNVWYLGEDTCEYEDDACVDTHGSWMWGSDGALPGIVMPAHPSVDGQPYYQEYYLGEAEDVGEVVAVDVTVDVPGGNFTGCITTHDTSTLDPELDEMKHYCPGVGLVKVDEPDLTEELVETSL